MPFISSVKNFFRQFFNINDTPHNIAAGAAVGIFLGVVPGPGITASLVLASILKINRLAAMAGALATNNWTTIIVFPLAAAMGGFMFGETRAALMEQFSQMHHLGFKFLFSKVMLIDIVLPLTVGFAVVSGGIAFCCYILTLSLMKMHRKSIAD